MRHDCVIHSVYKKKCLCSRSDDERKQRDDASIDATALELPSDGMEKVCINLPRHDGDEVDECKRVSAFPVVCVLTNTVLKTHTQFDQSQDDSWGVLPIIAFQSRLA